MLLFIPLIENGGMEIVMKNTKKKNIYLFNIIMGAICVLLMGISMLTSDMMILKVLFAIVVVSYAGMLICYFINRKELKK